MVFQVLGLTLLLAALDVAGSYAAAEWSRHGDAVRWIAGAGIFLVIFGIYGKTLSLANLTVIDSVWIAFGLLGAAAIDLLVYRVHYPIDVLAALASLLVLSVYVAWRMQ